MTHRPRLHRDPPTSPPPWQDSDTACPDCERTHPWRDHGPLDPDPLRPPEPPSVPELAHWAATGRPPRRFLPEPLEVADLASAWRSCLVRAGLLGLALILVGLAAAQLARAS